MHLERAKRNPRAMAPSAWHAAHMAYIVELVEACDDQCQLEGGSEHFQQWYLLKLAQSADDM